MGLFGKKKKANQETKSVRTGVNVKQIKQSHEVRIINLNKELESLTTNLRDSEIDTEMSRSDHTKISNKIILRMSLIRHEIDIRQELVQWL